MNLDLETIIKAVEELNSKFEQPIELILQNLLPDQTMLKVENKVYYSPRIKSGEVTVISFDPKEIIQKGPLSHEEKAALFQRNQTNIQELMEGLNILSKSF